MKRRSILLHLNNRNTLEKLEETSRVFHYSAEQNWYCHCAVVCVLRLLCVSELHS